MKNVIPTVEAMIARLFNLTTDTPVMFHVFLTAQLGTLKEQTTIVFPHSSATPLATPVKPKITQPSV